MSRSAVVLGVVLAGFSASRGWAQTKRAPVAPADVPSALALPPDEEPVLRLQARGTQNYECRPKREAPQQLEWVLVAPEADLFDAEGRKVGKHYAGPTWESTQDGSKVVGTVKARADAPDPDAVPWLLLDATSAGQGMFALVRSVQRVETHGGKAPASACQPGQAEKVPYTAVYYFSRARH
jgi:hypothetical protein